MQHIVQLRVYIILLGHIYFLSKLKAFLTIMSIENL